MIKTKEYITNVQNTLEKHKDFFLSVAKEHYYHVLFEIENFHIRNIFTHLDELYFSSKGFENTQKDLIKLNLSNVEKAVIIKDDKLFPEELEEKSKPIEEKKSEIKIKNGYLETLI